MIYSFHHMYYVIFVPLSTTLPYKSLTFQTFKHHLIAIEQCVLYEKGLRFRSWYWYHSIVYVISSKQTLRYYTCFITKCQLVIKLDVELKKMKCMCSIYNYVDNTLKSTWFHIIITKVVNAFSCFLCKQMSCLIFLHDTLHIGEEMDNEKHGHAHTNVQYIMLPFDVAHDEYKVDMLDSNTTITWTPIMCILESTSKRHVSKRD